MILLDNSQYMRNGDYLAAFQHVVLPIAYGEQREPRRSWPIGSWQWAVDSTASGV